MNEDEHARQNLLDPSDRGLQYGDGLFETMAVRDGRIPWLAYHLRRLRTGCRRLRFAPPRAAGLRREIAAQAAGQSRAIIKLIVTRGAGGRGYRPEPGARGHPIVMRHPWPAHAERRAREGIWLRVCRTRLASNSALAGLKHLNRLEQVLARTEWRDEDCYQEGLMLDQQDRVIEGTMTNLFIVRGGELLTPELTGSGVAGVMREIILEEAAQKAIPCQVTALSLADVAQADEILVCNSVVGIWPVKRLDKKRYPLGPVARQLADAVEARATDTPRGGK